jgi:hypothetical protein
LALKKFKESQSQFTSSHEEARQNDIQQTNRIIKKEVIDISEMLENTSKVMLLMNNKMDKLE